MDSFEFNKIAGAVLGTCLAVLALSIVSEAIFHAEAPEQPGYEIAVAEESTAGGEGAAEDEGPDLGTLLAAADPAEGEAATRPCQTCHTFEQGGGAQVGPNLYNVVGAEKAHMEGFNYSAAMQEAGAAGETWGYAELDAFLANPRGYMPGTTMSFAGVRDAEDRADIIQYLASLTESPPPLPEPAAEGGEAAEGDAATESEEPAAQDTGDGGETETEAPAEAEAPEEGAAPQEDAGAGQAQPLDAPGNPGAAGSAGAAGDPEQVEDGIVTPHQEQQ